MNADTRTHKNDDPVSILLPAFNHLVVFIFCNLGVYGEERPRAVTKVGFSLQCLTRCRLRVIAVAFYLAIYRRYEISEDRSNLRLIHTWVIPPLEVLVSGLRH